MASQATNQKGQIVPVADIFKNLHPSSLCDGTGKIAPDYNFRHLSKSSLENPIIPYNQRHLSSSHLYCTYSNVIALA